MFVLEETRSPRVRVGGEGSLVRGSCVLFEPSVVVSAHHMFSSHNTYKPVKHASLKSHGCWTSPNGHTLSCYMACDIWRECVCVYPSIHSFSVIWHLFLIGGGIQQVWGRNTTWTGHQSVGEHVRWVASSTTLKFHHVGSNSFTMSQFHLKWANTFLFSWLCSLTTVQSRFVLTSFWYNSLACHRQYLNEIHLLKCGFKSRTHPLCCLLHLFLCPL